MIMTYVQFREIYLSALNASQPNGGWPARPVYHDLARDGAYRAHGTLRSPRDKRTERRRWMLLGPTPSDLDAAFGDLLSEIGQFGRLVGRTDAGLSLWTDAELLDVRALSAPRPVVGRSRGVGMDVETEFMLPTTAWFAELQETLVFADIYDDASGSGDLLMMKVMGATPGSAVATTWDIQGRANVTKMTITLSSGTGAGDGVTKLRLVNATTGYTLEWNGTLPAGQVLVIDTDPESVLRNDVEAYSQLTLGAHTRWMELAPGINSVTVTMLDTATDDSTRLEVAYYPAYP